MEETTDYEDEQWWGGNAVRKGYQQEEGRTVWRVAKYW
jgi:hypothetical protein